MSKFVRRVRAVKPKSSSSSSSSENEADEKVTDVGEVPSSPKLKPYSKDLGLLRFNNNRMFVGKKYVKFADDDIYRSAAKHFCKDIDGQLEDEIITTHLNDDQRRVMQKELKRGKRLITTHPDYEDGTLKLNKEFTYNNPIPKRAKKEKIEEISSQQTNNFPDFEEVIGRMEKKIKECEEKFITFEERYQTQVKATSGSGKKEMSKDELRKYYGFDSL